MSQAVADSSHRSSGLLVAGDPGPVIVHNKSGSSPLLLLGDHAGRVIPQRLNTLGLDPAALDRHIAWDIGIAGLGRLLSAALDATFIEQAYSRLVIDCNRRPLANGSIAERSDGTDIPGNRGLTDADKQARLDAIYHPYQDQIARILDARGPKSDQQGPTTLVALHSFTPSMSGFDRPWRYGVLHRGDSVYSRTILARLQAALGEAIVGDNQPYSMDGTDNTIPLHADARGLDYLELEVRQDLLADAEGQGEVAAFLAPLLVR